MQSISTVALIEQELNGDAVLEDRAVGAHQPKSGSPPGDDRLAHSASMVASADANSNSSNTEDDDDDDDDDDTQSDADDESGDSSDGTSPETEALEKEMERYVARTKPSKPAIGAQPSNPSYAQGTVSQRPGTKGGRPPAVTATVKTTASRPKK